MFLSINDYTNTDSAQECQYLHKQNLLFSLTLTISEVHSTRISVTLDTFAWFLFVLDELGYLILPI